MELNKKNMKNLILLIVFAVLFYVGAQRIRESGSEVFSLCAEWSSFILAAHWRLF